MAFPKVGAKPPGQGGSATSRSDGGCAVDLTGAMAVDARNMAGSYDSLKLEVICCLVVWNIFYFPIYWE